MFNKIILTFILTGSMSAMSAMNMEQKYENLKEATQEKMEVIEDKL